MNECKIYFEHTNNNYVELIVALNNVSEERIEIGIL
jgi:hypothetical protein